MISCREFLIFVSRVSAGGRCFGLQAIQLLSPQVGPDEKRPEPSQGNKNPAVLKYDPTGLRSTMSATNTAWEESLQV